MIIRDLYIRNPEDPNYRITVLEHSDDIEAIISKIKMLLGTRQGAILGDINFGLGIEDLVFETTINKNELEERIKKQIYQYITETSQYKIRPEVQFGRAEGGYDFCVIDIFINEEKVAGVLVK